MKLKKYTSKVSLLTVGLVISVLALLVSILWGTDSRYVIDANQARQIAYGYAVQDCFKALGSDAGICSKLKVTDSREVKDDPIARVPAYWQYVYFLEGSTNNFSADVSLDRTGQRFVVEDKGQWRYVR